MEGKTPCVSLRRGNRSVRLFRGFMFSGKPLDYQDEPLANNGFWPDLNLKDFQAQRSLPPDIDADTISQALLLSRR